LAGGRAEDIHDREPTGKASPFGLVRNLPHCAAGLADSGRGL